MNHEDHEGHEVGFWDTDFADDTNGFADCAHGFVDCDWRAERR